MYYLSLWLRSHRGALTEEKNIERSKCYSLVKPVIGCIILIAAVNGFAELRNLGLGPYLRNWTAVDCMLVKYQIARIVFTSAVDIKPLSNLRYCVKKFLGVVILVNGLTFRTWCAVGFDDHDLGWENMSSCGLWNVRKSSLVWDLQSRYPLSLIWDDTLLFWASLLGWRLCG